MESTNHTTHIKQSNAQWTLSLKTRLREIKRALDERNRDAAPEKVLIETAEEAHARQALEAKQAASIACFMGLWRHSKIASEAKIAKDANDTLNKKESERRVELEKEAEVKRVEATIRIAQEKATQEEYENQKKRFREQQDRYMEVMRFQAAWKQAEAVKAAQAEAAKAKAQAQARAQAQAAWRQAEAERAAEAAWRHAEAAYAAWEKADIRGLGQQMGAVSKAESDWQMAKHMVSIVSLNDDHGRILSESNIAIVRELVTKSPLQRREWLTLLGESADATSSTTRNAYVKKVMLKVHPDKHRLLNSEGWNRMTVLVSFTFEVDAL